jgi:hypothetical protein
MLMCPDGGCKAVEEYGSCNLAKSPARAGKPPLPGSKLESVATGTFSQPSPGG